MEVTLNSLKARGELLIYETSYASLNDFLEKEKAEEIRRGFLKSGIKVRQLTNRAYHEEYTAVPGYHQQVMDIRYVDPKKLEIKTETLIYNNTTAFYTTQGDVFCVEIISEELARMQRQIFEFVWKTGERPILGKNGRSSLF